MAILLVSLFKYNKVKLHDNPMNLVTVIYYGDIVSHLISTQELIQDDLQYNVSNCSYTWMCL